MMERMLLEYLVNSLWQAPLLALGAWLALRAGRPGPRVQHGVWVAAHRRCSCSRSAGGRERCGAGCVSRDRAGERPVE